MKINHRLTKPFLGLLISPIIPATVGMCIFHYIIQMGDGIRWDSSSILFGLMISSPLAYLLAWIVEIPAYIFLDATKKDNGMNYAAVGLIAGLVPGFLLSNGMIFIPILTAVTGLTTALLFYFIAVGSTILKYTDPVE